MRRFLEGCCASEKEIKKQGSSWKEGREGGGVGGSMDKEQAMSSVHHRPRLVHSGVPTPSTAWAHDGEKRMVTTREPGAGLINVCSFVCLTLKTTLLRRYYYSPRFTHCGDWSYVSCSRSQLGSSTARTQTCGYLTLSQHSEPPGRVYGKTEAEPDDLDVDGPLHPDRL